MTFAVFALLACLLQEPAVDDLIRQLGSDSLTERQEAERRLQARGQEAKSPLEKAARSADPEVASRAKRLLGLLAVLEREQLTPELQAELPGLVEKLQAAGDQAWFSAFLDRSAAGEKSLKSDTWAILAPRAARAAKTVEDRAKICDALVRVPVPAAAPELVRYFLEPLNEFGDPDPMLRSAIKALSGMKARRELLRIVIEYGELRDERRRTNPNLVFDALRALIELKARAEILEIARKEDAFTAGEAARELASAGDREAIAELQKLLGSKNAWVRHHAALAMGRCQVREAKPALGACPSNPDFRA